MLMSSLFGATLRDAPAGAESSGNQMLLRGGYVRQVGAGIFAFLPLGLRVARRLEAIIRQEMERAGAVEVSLPVVLPAELLRASGRYEAFGRELIRMKDRRDRDLALAMTLEEVVATLASTEVQSWRQLPRAVFQIQTKFRDDPRPRAGLLRTREFVMKDAYTLDRDEAGLAVQYRAMHEAYVRIFARCGLPALAVEADVGMMGGSLAHEFMYPTEVGEDTVILCDSCGYAKNRQVAESAVAPSADEELRALERVATPGTTTIESLCRLLGIESARTAKVVFVAATVPTADSELFLVAVVRGDASVNETKLANAVGAAELRPMTEEEIAAIGCVPGYASPIGLGGRATVVVDPLVAASPNLVAGANEPGYHLLNVNAGRDYEADITTDITAAEPGDPCVECGAPLRAERAVEVGNIFRLGTTYSEAAGARFLDEDGTEQLIVMGCYGIGIGRLLACLAEEYSDGRGVVWPPAVAPFGLHLVSLGPEESARLVAGDLYASLLSDGFDVLYDDRDERPGVKFADADLIGAPWRVTVSPRSLAAGGAEVKARAATEPEIVPTAALAGFLAERLGSGEAR
ncbi:MAG TPA: proline--tRNA ligase [Acidimicrobiales bacterium]|jgi:prolyl-tRNA synthetase|nr:proline--tRNA ligase [Acidimicrobiales bacterium]